ncbi:MAG: SurA N-terminal domain-containing protein [Endomicrobium sp.]|uniref:SurA N-terminal domain-containing protein n=1 Tax=Candidatus Endomicrobiellum cubanum TaxID=3242325 RepID=UPI00282CC730|nr:SurA N-terminal domain-containing protein [Endomicrobium sp.]MDR2395648.1 SurA N-terminal domain-containing protein [Endomicrobium sp.]
MMNFFRKHVRVIFIITIVAFVGVIVLGAVVNFSGSNDYAVKVNGKKIPLRLYMFVYENAVESYQKMYERYLSDKEKQEIKSNILQVLVQDEIFFQQSKFYCLSVTDEELRLDLQNSLQFKENGVFSHTKYITFLKTLGMSPKEYELLRKKQIAGVKLKMLLASSIKLWNYEVESLNIKTTREDLFSAKINMILNEWYQQEVKNSKIVSNDLIFK